MNDDRTLKFAVDGFCSSRTMYVYKNTVPTVGFYCFYTFLCILKLLFIYKFGLNKMTVLFLVFRHTGYFSNGMFLLTKTLNAAKHETFSSLYYTNMHMSRKSPL